MKAQASIEYLIIIGLVLLITIPLFQYGLSKSTESIRYQQAADAVNVIARTADEVHSQGIGSKDSVFVTTPSGINEVIVNGKTITLRLSISGGNSDFIGISRANLSATQDFLDKIVLSGTYKVDIETFENTTSNTIMVLLGGFCGDDICSGAENSETCLADCEQVCGDGICNYPGDAGYREACLTDYCSDCIDSIADCDPGDVCAEVNGNVTCVQGPGFCGDGYCYNEPYTEDCNNCVEDCAPQIDEICCYDAVIDNYYRAPECGIPPTVTSCPDWCVFVNQGYETGICAQTSNKCDDFTPLGGNWVKIDDYDIDGLGNGGGFTACNIGGEDNECDGDEFCFAGAQANTCCCIFL